MTIGPNVLLACDPTVADTETPTSGLPDLVDAQAAVGDSGGQPKSKCVQYQSYESEIVNMVVDTICIAIV